MFLLINLKIPLIYIAILLAFASASSIKWVDNKMDNFLYLEILELTLHMFLFTYGSIRVEGSSNNNIWGLAIISIAINNFLLFPPDKVNCYSFIF